MTTPSIRLARAKEGRIVLNGIRCAADRDEAPRTEDKILEFERGYLDPASTSRCYVATVNGEGIIGYVWFKLQSRFMGPNYVEKHCGQIYHVFVLPCWQKTRVGQRLLRRALIDLDDASDSPSVVIAFSKAMGFYEKCGFKYHSKAGDGTVRLVREKSRRRRESADRCAYPPM